MRLHKKCLTLAAVLVGCSRTDRSAEPPPPATLEVHGGAFTVTAWGRSVQFTPSAFGLSGRLDTAGAVRAIPVLLTGGRMLDQRPVGDVIYALLTIDGAAADTVALPCGITDRETILAAIRVPKVGDVSRLRTVRYASCLEKTTHDSLSQTSDSIWVNLTSSARKRAAHVSYDLKHPERGLVLREEAAAIPPKPDPAPKDTGKKD